MNLLQLISACVCISGILASPVLVEEFDIEANDSTAITVPPSVSAATMDIVTTMPSVATFSTASSEPIISIETQTTSKTTPSSVTPAIISTMPTTRAPPPPPEKETGFDGASFGGGIGTGIGICIVLLICWKIYITKRGKGYSTM